jgi:hypothetical protein
VSEVEGNSSIEEEEDRLCLKWRVTLVLRRTECVSSGEKS